MSTGQSSGSWDDQMLRAVNEAVLVLDLKGVVVHWNHGAERLYGWTSAEAVGTHIDDLLVDVEDEVEPLESVMAGSGCSTVRLVVPPWRTFEAARSDPLPSRRRVQPSGKMAPSWMPR